MYIQKKHNQRK